MTDLDQLLSRYTKAAPPDAPSRDRMRDTHQRVVLSPKGHRAAGLFLRSLAIVNENVLERDLLVGMAKWHEDIARSTS